jgi:hypothetical protein
MPSFLGRFLFVVAVEVREVETGLSTFFCSTKLLVLVGSCMLIRHLHITAVINSGELLWIEPWEMRSGIWQSASLHTDAKYLFPDAKLRKPISSKSPPPGIRREEPVELYCECFCSVL